MQSTFLDIAEMIQLKVWNEYEYIALFFTLLKNLR
jgi:hypothetical protein